MTDEQFSEINRKLDDISASLHRLETDDGFCKGHPYLHAFYPNGICEHCGRPGRNVSNANVYPSIR